MREYEVYVIEKLVSTVTVEAEDKQEAYEKAMELLSKEFYAPYHDGCDVMDYKVTEI